MTGRATFGDFLQAAHRHLDPPPGTIGQPPARGDAGEVSQSLLRMLTVMGRYLRDLATAFDGLPTGTQSARSTWASACIEAREAAAHSALFLARYRSATRWPAAPAVSPLARRLDGVATSLATGRDLLQTHFTAGSKGGRQHRSEWALIIASPAATRAMLAEFATLSRVIARQGTDLALGRWPGRRDSAEARRALNAACQWLWALNATVQAAHQREPVAAADTELLHAIPVNAPPPRRLPDGSETIVGLCEGTIDTTRRLRHLAWDAAQDAPWSPGMSAASLQQVAAASTVTSHNCQLVLRALAARTSQPGSGPLRAHLTAAAGAARHARQAWLQVAHALDEITTDTPRHQAQPASETRDLALWTGRLAYASPQWTPASGPAHPARPPHSLAPEPGHVPAVIAAVHHASETLTRLAQAEQERILEAARTGRILVTTRSLPDGYDVPRPFAHAPRERVERLLARYREAGEAGRQVTAALGPAAEATGAPSRVLTIAVAATSPDRDMKGMTPNGSAQPDASPDADVVPGPVERTLRDLGITQPAMLQRGTEIDRASTRLIIDAATELPPGQQRPVATAMGWSAGSAEVVNHALDSGDPHAAALLRPAAVPGREPPEREP